jgi:DNA-binding NarL/FixJ family response regulator
MRREVLSSREKQVCRLILKGCDNEEIGKVLRMRVRTAKSHLHRIYSILGVKNHVLGRAYHRRVMLASLLWHEQYRQLMLEFKLTCSTFPKNSPLAKPLTKKETRIANLVTHGLINVEIALMIGTTENVIKNYLVAIMDKTGTWSRLELALWGMEHRSIISIPEDDLKLKEPKHEETTTVNTDTASSIFLDPLSRPDSPCITGQ